MMSFCWSVLLTPADWGLALKLGVIAQSNWVWLRNADETCDFDHSRGAGGRIPCGVTARGSPSGPLQFDRLGIVDVREIVDP